MTSDLQGPPYFPPPPGLSSVLGLSQEQQTLFNSLPVSLASLQPSVSQLPTSNDGFHVSSSSLQSFSQQRRLTLDSSSPLSIVSCELLRLKSNDQILSASLPRPPLPPSPTSLVSGESCTSAAAQWRGARWTPRTPSRRHSPHP